MLPIYATPPSPLERGGVRLNSHDLQVVVKKKNKRL
jgi:hypothetical protein